MTVRHAGTRIRRDGMGTPLNRRGILTAAGAIVAGIVAKQASQPVAADGATWTLPYSGTAASNLALIFVDNTGTGSGVIGYAASNAGVQGQAFDGSHNGVEGFASGVGNGVSGDCSGTGGGDGVHGTSSSGYGVHGVTTAQPDVGWAGVAGVGNKSGSYGVYGGSTNGTGVKGNGGPFGVVGNAFSTTVANTVAVYGSNSSTTSGGIGVLGQCDVATGIGVRGISNLGTGVSGTSNGNTGVFGTTTAAGFSALGGIVSTPGTAAFAGTSTNPNAFAGFFTGDVFVNGNFTVQDPTRKHGAIQHPDGSLRLLYSMESPESWLEDFGAGQLVGGQATVALDPDFAAVVQTDGYYVFAMPRDAGCKGLAVVAQSASGFTVQELSGGTSSGGFNYRVVAKPRTTNKAVRMARFTVPEIKVPQPPPMPSVPVGKVPDTPPQPAPPARPTGPAGVSPAGSPAAAPQGSGTTTATGTAAPTVQPVPPPRP